jgi:hypothetical protein
MSVLKADTIQSTSGGAATLTKQSAAKHWIHFNLSSPSIYGSFNTTSITDDGTGEATVTLTNAMSGADGWAIVGSTDGNQVKIRSTVGTASTYDHDTQNSAGGLEDRDDNSAIATGDLA